MPVRFRRDVIVRSAALVILLVLSAVSLQTPASASAADTEAGFEAFVQGLWPDAQARHVSRDTFDAAFKGVTLDPRIAKAPEQQAEFVRPIWDYIASAVIPARIATGKAKASQWSAVLARAEKEFGVDRSVILAVWAMETGFGAFSGNESVVRVLATLAYTSYQGDMFKRELLDALDILQAGDVSAGAMRGSWAGAMGQPQFLPSSFKAYAVDYDGDGKRNIWTSVPDSLGSIASYLKGQGWRAGLPWGFEVVLPPKFEPTHNEETTFAPFAAWSARGVRRADGGKMPDSGDAMLLIPAGIRGAAFLVTSNFKVIKVYNNATSYALCVALLADRIAGRGALVGTWPVKEKLLDTASAKELQTKLKELGYDVGVVDGKIGEKARDAILAFEAKAGLPPDGYPNAALLAKVRAAH